MLLHEAVRRARKDLGLSQKRLSELAGIQRKQLATLESGGNITLSTLRKVLAHLPNLETFSLDAVTATVRRQVSPKEQQAAVEASMELLGTALRSLVTAMTDGKLPDEEAMRGLRKATDVLYSGLGYSPEDVERERRAIAAERVEREAAAQEIAGQTLLRMDEAGAIDLEELARQGFVTIADHGEDEGEEGDEAADDEAAADDVTGEDLAGIKHQPE